MDFFSRVYAQSDGVAKSTIPFTIPGVASPTPFVSGAVTPTPTIVPTIYLEATTNQMGVNQKVTVKIRINTANIPIKSFRLVVKYDSEYFQITDALSEEANTQITFNDTFFINDINEVETSTGTINVNASSNEGTTTITNRPVAEFELTSKKEGFSQVAVLVNDSSLLDSNNVDILESGGTPIDFVISNTQITVTPTTPLPTPTGNLPKNGIFDDLGTGGAFFIGILLVGAGAYLYKIQKNAKKKH